MAELRHEKWMYENIKKLNVKVCMGVGGVHNLPIRRKNKPYKKTLTSLHKHIHAFSRKRQWESFPLSPPLEGRGVCFLGAPLKRRG
jgi:hypothetical protein